MKKKFYAHLFVFLFSGIILYAQQIQPGLYVGDAFQGEMDFYDALDWITINAQDGGGVFVDGSFTMNGGAINGNSATKSGGGVLVDSGTFVKSNNAGIIYGSDAPEDKANKADVYGHAVYTNNGRRDTTSRATKALDSRKQGAEGGWE